MSTEESKVEAQGLQYVAAWRIALKSFTSQWFLIPQGTGIIAVILHQLHYHFHGLNIIADVFWVVTIFTLIVFLLIYLFRVMLFPRHIVNQFRHNVMEAACLASISISFTTIIQMMALTLTASWSPGWGMAAWVMWWLNAAMAAICCIALPYVFTKVEGLTIDWVPPAVLLPLIAALTAAAGGGVVCRYGAVSPELQVPVIIVSYLFIGLGLPLSVVVDAVFLARVSDQAFTVQQKVYQLMILCGPLGQGSFALQILGTCVQRGAFAKYDNSSFVSVTGAKTVPTISEWLGLITWGYGTFWWAVACVAILHYLLTNPRELLRWDKSLSAWSMVFPWGVYTNAAVQLGVVLNSRAFWVWQTVAAIADLHMAGERGSYAFWSWKRLYA